MKITVMTADEQIISLDVDPHESVTLPKHHLYSHACMHTCVCIFIYIYVVVNNLIDTNVFSLFLAFLKSGFVSIG